MTALSANQSRARRDGDVAVFGVQAAANVRQGSLLEIDGDGNVKPATKAADKVYVGVALEPADNTGGAKGAIKVTVRLRGAFRFTKTGTAAVGKTAYVADDNTVTDVAAGASKVGRIIDSDSGGVWVNLHQGV